MARKNTTIRTTLFDPLRSILVQATPEEIVRQNLVRILIEEMAVPVEAVSTEYPLNHLDSNTLMRADVVVWYREDRFGVEKPLIVFEVKAQHIEITDLTINQVLGYQKILQCPFVGVTNGTTTFLYAVNEEGEIKLLADSIYSYDQLVGKNVLYASDTLKMRRLNYEEVSYSRYISFLIDEGYIGVDTPTNMQSFMSELQNMLMTETVSSPFPVTKYGITIKEDISYSYLTYGNAAGGSFTGYYRGFVVEDLDGNEQIYRLAVFGTGSTKDHPTFGNRKGTTVVFVTIDHHLHGAHNALQLNLDRSLKNTSDASLYRIVHDGRMTINKGAIKKQEVLDFVRETDVDWINDDGIELGLLPSKRSIFWEDAEEFIFRIFLYATLREKLRAKYNPRKKTSKSKRQIVKKI